jgi:hypothetical protein
MKTIYLKILALISFIIMIVANALANILPINNITTGQISDSYPNLFAPAPFTFSIWGLIYLLLFIYTIYQFFLKGKDEEIIKKISPYYIASSLINAAWIFAWHYEQMFLSVILMLGILYCLIKIASIMRDQKLEFMKNLFISVPFSIYFGWITVATVANITVFLVSTGWNGFGVSEPVWTAIILLVAASIGILRTFYDKKIAYILVFIWAYYGILSNHISFTGFDGNYPLVIYMLYACISLFMIIIFYLLFHNKNKKVG